MYVLIFEDSLYLYYVPDHDDPDMVNATFSGYYFDMVGYDSFYWKMDNGTLVETEPDLFFFNLPVFSHKRLEIGLENQNPQHQRGRMFSTQPLEFIMARLERFELPTYRFVACCSIQLSHKRVRSEYRENGTLRQEFRIFFSGGSLR